MLQGKVLELLHVAQEGIIKDAVFLARIDHYLKRPETAGLILDEPGLLEEPLLTSK